MTTLFERLVPFLVDTVLRTTVLLALAALAAALLRRASASLRHLIWTLGLASALCLPFLFQALPSWQVAVLPPAAHRPSVSLSLREPGESFRVPDVATSGVPVSRPPDVIPEASAAAPSLPPASSSRLPWSAGVLIIWGVGASLFLARLALGLIGVRRIRQNSSILTEGSVAQSAAAAMVTLGVRRPVVLRQVLAPGQVAVPLTYGSLRPVIVLPAEATDWPAERLRAALLHELAHVRRWDWPLHIVTQVIRALYWFHPLVWLAATRVRAESETACDDLVLAAGVPAPEYARHLLDVALGTRYGQAGSGLGAAVAMAQTPEVEKRLRLILALGRSRREITSGLRSVVLAIAAGVLVTGSVIRLTSRAAVAQLPAVEVPAATAPRATTSAEEDHIARGLKLQQEGQPRDGIPEFRRAVQLNPKNAEAHKHLASALYAIKFRRVGNTTYAYPAPHAVLDEAIEHLRKAVALRPNHADWHSSLGTYLSNRGRHREAIAEYRRVLRLLPPVEPFDIRHGEPGNGAAQAAFDNHWLLGSELLKTGQAQDAMYHLRQALRFNPTANWVLLDMGNALNRSGRRSEARRYWKKVMASTPPNTYYWESAQAMLRRYRAL